jgi:membrane fusion protein, heavy metal efflux system
MRKLFFIAPLFLFFACSPSNEKGISDQESTENEGIVFTQEQIKRAGVQTAKVKLQTIAETIACNGKIEVPQQNRAMVSTAIGGTVKALNFFPGDNVEKGAVLAVLQHPEFIELQQKYMEAKSQIDYYREEFKRQGELTVENAASIKNMQRAKADYNAAEAAYKSYKAQLEIIGVNTEKIEKGNYQNEFYAIAPISGSIAKLNAHIGKYISSDEFIFEIINNAVLNIHLSIFEKDIHKIAVGQKVIFKLLNDTKKHETTVKRVGVEIDELNRTTMVHCIIENKNLRLKQGMFVNAEILVSERESIIVPLEAIVNTEDESFLFIKDNDRYYKVIVEKGIERDGYCEILNPDNRLADSDVVIKGVYYLHSFTELNE